MNWGLVLAALILASHALAERAPENRRSRSPSQEAMAEARRARLAASEPVLMPPQVAVGIRAGGTGSFAQLATEDTSNGIGYAVAIPVYIPMGNTPFRLSIIPGFQNLRLTRIIDGTGQVVDPNPVEFTQSIRFLSAGAIFGFNLNRGAMGPSAHGMAIWIEGGVDFLYPISAVQTDNFGGEEPFSSRDRLLFGILGVAAEYRFSSGFGLGADIAAGYNLFADSGNKLVTTRFSLDAVFHL